VFINRSKQSKIRPLPLKLAQRAIVTLIGADRPPNDARVAYFGVTDLPGFVDFFTGQADVGGGRFGAGVSSKDRPQSGTGRAMHAVTVISHLGPALDGAAEAYAEQGQQ
jgi:hypothetical protein